jgi:hypothetical protein
MTISKKFIPIQPLKYEGKVAGLGFSIGKKVGISTSVGGFSINLEEATENCIQ